MELTKEHYKRAEIGYEAYCKQAGGRSLVSGEKLPTFDNLHREIKDAWAAVGIALSLEADRACRNLTKAVRSLTERAAFGDQCYQDRCENAYVEQTVMQRTVSEAEAAVASRCVEICREYADRAPGGLIPVGAAAHASDAIRREFGIPVLADDRWLSTPESDSTASTTHENPK